jgi:hypothetical protein
MAETKSFGKFDEYTRNARLKPAFITIIPIALLSIGLGVKISALATVVITPLAALGLTTLMAEFARDLGRNKEPALFKQWGGRPSTLKLRHSDKSLNIHTRARYHGKLQLLLGKQMPDADEETRDLNSADAIYETAGDLLREKTRDTIQYRLVFEELMGYGFRRNLWALKPLALPICCVCTAVSTGLVVFEGFGAGVELVVAATAVLNWLVLAYWLFRITPEWVRQSANEYANRLLSSLDTM